MKEVVAYNYTYTCSSTVMTELPKLGIECVWVTVCNRKGGSVGGGVILVHDACFVFL